MRIIGLDIHRAFAEAVAWEDGSLRRLGRVDMRRDLLEAFAAKLSLDNVVVIEATGNASSAAAVVAPHVKKLECRPRALCRRAAAPSAWNVFNSRLAAATLVIRRSTIFDKTSIRRSSRSLIKTSPNLQSPALSNAGRLARQERHSYFAKSGHFNLAPTRISCITCIMELDGHLGSVAFSVLMTF
ncbi:hypothetical protein [Mesorhizobium sp.]|uniref:hypothetical protein n=1 Tax=Mesorhizobium sp. TaxID=1871066 RepID=UPI0025FB3DDE|nr:hypothetical protein [Mesorhizobium sp.]